MPTNTAPSTEPRGEALAKRLTGPFADVAAYCATQKVDDDHICRAVDGTYTPVIGTVEPPLLELATIFVTDQAPTSGCVILLRTARGWFATPRSEDACFEPSYIELKQVNVGSDAAVTTIQLDVNWHTKPSRTGEGDGSADYTLTVFCGMAGDTPACSPMFATKCEASAPVTGCTEAGYEISWKITGTSVTFETTAKPANPNVPVGTQRLF